MNPDPERGCTELSADEKYEIPWQYYGYPALSRWMASSNDFFVLRRFAPLQVRCLLHLQDQIATKGRELERWDKIAMDQEPGLGCSGWIDCDPEALAGHPRPRILRELLPLLKEYSKFPKTLSCTSLVYPKLMVDADELATVYASLRGMPTASSRQITNVDNWHKSYGEDAIALQEQHYKGNEHDLITLRQGPQRRLVTLLASLVRLVCRVCSQRRSKDSDQRSITHTSPFMLEILASFLVLTVALSMAFASIWLLNFVSSKVYRLAVITASGTLMTLIAWAAAGNKPVEILATFAAYMAVLMIYQQINP
jgi:hypothetical protein